MGLISNHKKLQKTFFKNYHSASWKEKLSSEEFQIFNFSRWIFFHSEFRKTAGGKNSHKKVWNGKRHIFFFYAKISFNLDSFFGNFNIRENFQKRIWRRPQKDRRKRRRIISILLTQNKSKNIITTLITGLQNLLFFLY